MLKIADHPADHCKPSAIKRGRDARWPHVPVIQHPTGRTEQLRGFAFPTREEAIEHARKHLKTWRAHDEARVNLPNYRALRVSFRLPRELEPQA